VNEFAYLIRPAFDKAFAATAGDRERTVVEAHWEYLLELDRAGRLVYAGRCYDGPFGIVVIRAKDEAEARATMKADPSVVAGVQTAELHPFKTGLVGGAA
jgi:uncharacterized protein YciI